MADIDVLIGKVSEHIVNPLIVLLIAAALLVFLWGVFEYIRNLDNEEERARGGRHMLWGVIGLTIMVSALGIVALIKNTIGIP